MEYFGLYIKLGWDHILDLTGYDHLLFVAALAGIYVLAQLRQLFLLVTAFTLGHSLTLLLASLQVVYLPSPIIEFLIPCTIAITCVSNWFATPSRPTLSPPNFMMRYLVAFSFGLVHGIGFSNYLRQMLTPGDDLLIQLLCFNVGLELGQLVVVAVIMLVGWLLFTFTKVKLRDWNLVLSSFILALAVLLIVEQGHALKAAASEGPLWHPEQMAPDSTGAFNPFNKADSSATAVPDSSLAVPDNAVAPGTKSTAMPVTSDSLPPLKVTVDSAAR
jgi:hypothetical protein